MPRFGPPEAGVAPQVRLDSLLMKEQFTLFVQLDGPVVGDA